MSRVFPVRPVPIVWPEGIEQDEAFAEVVSYWQEVVAEYEADPTRRVYAWRYLAHHPAFWQRSDWGGVYYAAWYDSIEGGYAETANGKEYYWLEIGPKLWPGDLEEGELRQVAPALPDRKIECEAPTHDDAILVAASMVHDRYGNDRKFLEPPLSDPEGRWFG